MFFLICPAKANERTNIQSKQTYYFGNPVCIKSDSVLPDNLEDQRLAAFKILRPILSRNSSNMSVLWQKDNFSFGKRASIAGVYISDFLNKKISTEKFIDHINLELIEPTQTRKNIVEPAKIVDVSQSNMIISVKLREKADLYRMLGSDESALRIYKQTVEINPNDYISMYWIGKIYNDRKKTDLAKEYFTKALGLNPDFRSADDALYEIVKNETNK